MSRLSKAQQALMDALRAGARILRSSDYPKYWLRTDTGKKCTVAASSLLDTKLVQMRRANPAVRLYEHELLIVQPAATPAKPLTRCAAGRDGECAHAQCPQLRDNEPGATGRHCPLDTMKGGAA